jgi:hypothetical protein
MWHWYAAHLYPHLTPLLAHANHIAEMNVALVTVGITVYRYIAVRHQLHYRQWCTKSRAKYTVILIMLFSITLDGCGWVGHGATASLINGSVEIAASERQPWFQTNVHDVILLITAHVLPMVLISSLNIATLRSTRKSARQVMQFYKLSNIRYSATSHYIGKVKQRNGTASWIVRAVLVWTILFQAVTVVSVIIENNVACHQRMTVCTTVRTVLVSVHTILTPVNSVINAVVYSSSMRQIKMYIKALTLRVVSIFKPAQPVISIV